MSTPSKEILMFKFEEPFAMCVCMGQSAECIFRKNCASVPEERSAIPLQTEQSSAG